MPSADALANAPRGASFVSIKNPRTSLIQRIHLLENTTLIGVIFRRIADVNNNRILELGYSQPPILGFAATAVGKTSADSPQSLTIGNNGNVSLDITGLTVGPNFTQVPGSGTPADCTSSTTLAAGASCNLSLSFKPAATGPLSGSAVLTDSLGVQSVTVLGTGVAPAASISAINP